MWSTAALISCALVVVVFPFSPQWSRDKLEATILDVGQGDSIFVVSPQGQTMLIDGGGASRGFPGHEERGGIDPGEDAVSPFLWSRGFKRLDVVALTHAHQDHLGGLNAILENFRVGRLWISREADSHSLTALETLAQRKGIAVEHEARGQKFQWSGVSGEFFWPSLEFSASMGAPKNNDSLVLRLHYHNRTILLAGDAEKGVERTMLAENSAEHLQADVLKVGHHGSKNSTMPDFLAAVHPQIAIVSAGEDNPYGHPSPVLLERLQSAGAQVFRTDQAGSVTILTDGDKLEVSCFLPCGTSRSQQALRQPQFPDREQHGQNQ
jgi:competence protein ComEC